MAHAVTSPPILRIKRSAQSGMKAMAAAYAVVYTESCPMAYYFAGGKINLSGMLAGDIIDIRMRIMLIAAGAWAALDADNYVGVQPAGHQVAYITPLPDVYGVEIACRQTAGVLLNIECEFYDAKRLGLT